jgi:adenylate cyclase
MRRVLIFTLMVYHSLSMLVTAQSNHDSLYAVWQSTAQKDSVRIIAFSRYIKSKYLFSKPDSAYILSNELYNFSLSKSRLDGQALACNLQGISQYLIGDYPTSLGYFKEGYELFNTLGNKRSTANALGNIGNIYVTQGDYSRGLDYFLKSLKVAEEYGDDGILAATLANIGVIYHNQNENEKALEYFMRSLDIGRKIDNKRIAANALGNMGMVYLDNGDLENALDYYKQSLALNQNIENVSNYTATLRNIGSVYIEMGEFDLALDYLGQSLTASENLGDKQGIASSKNKIGKSYSRILEYQKALTFCTEGYTMALEIGALLQQQEACNCLYLTYKELNQNGKALKYYELFKSIEDSLQVEETSKKLQQMEFQKTMLQDSIAKAEEARLLKEAHQEEIKKKNQSRNTAYVGGFIALLLAGGFYSRWRFVRRSKEAIEREKNRSENLLLNILPAEIAQELKEKGKADARDFDQVSILFTDFADFTEQSAQLSAADLVNEINHCFEAFDAIMEKYGIEKIKTIGDAYMAAGGLPVPTQNSTKNTVLAALEMQEFHNKPKNNFKGAKPIRLWRG